MAIIDKITKLTNSRFLNMYEVDGHNDKGHVSHYMVASRAKEIENLKINTGENSADGVMIFAVLKEHPDKVVLIRQYRYPLGGYVYECPAGLCEAGEDFHEAAVRELHEETGLTFTPIKADSMFEEPRFTSVGMTDESVASVFGYAEGEISDAFMEQSEEIQVVIADKAECRRILKEERVALNCAFLLMRFISDENPFGFLDR